VIRILNEPLQLEIYMENAKHAVATTYNFEKTLVELERFYYTRILGK